MQLRSRPAALRALEANTIAAGPLARYSVALGVLVVAVAVRLMLGPWFHHSMSHATALAAIIPTAWLCGLGPGVVVAIVGYPLTEYILLGHTAANVEPSYLASTLTLYAIISAAIITFITWQRSEREHHRDAEARLRTSERRVRAAFENAALGIVEVDRDNRLLEVNERMCRIVGYPREQLLGKTVRELTYPDDLPTTEELNDALVTGTRETMDLEKRYVRSDGSPIWVHITATPVRDDAGRFLYGVGTIEDIGQRKSAEQALLAAKASAEEANQAKDRFLATLSHELRTPLTPVLAAVQLLQRQSGLPDSLGSPLEIMRRNVTLEARLIDDLLDLTRVVQGKLMLDRKQIHVGSLIERAVETTRPDIDARKLHFGLYVQAGAERVYGDMARLQQVVWNLLHNAVKFTPAGGCVGLRCYAADGRVVIEVSDSGIGFEPSAAAGLFNAFEQGGAGITRQFGGLGLGLAIVKRLVAMHEGTVTAHSDGPGRGATFRVSLPALPRDAAQPEAADRPAARATGQRILLVEDNGDTAITMSMLLESIGYRVKTAGDVSQALEALARDGGFDLLVSDLGLPDRSGIELMKELRSRGILIKGIALTGYGMEEDVARTREAGFSVHLTKPIDMDVLIQTVERLL